MNPMYLAYDPPMMLPTITMNPTGKTTATSTAASTSTANAKREYSTEDEYDLPFNKYASHIKLAADKSRYVEHAKAVWWIGIGMSLLGGVAYLL